MGYAHSTGAASPPPTPIKESPTKTGWLHQAGRNMLVFWPAKMAGLVGGMTGFFVAYFWVLQHPLHPPAIMPHTLVDQWIGFQPVVLPLYLSLWFYVSLAPTWLVARREIVGYCTGVVVIGAAGLGIFYFWPTTVRWSDTDWSQHPAFAFLQSVDASGNACPSLHVAFAVFTACWLGQLLQELGAGSRVRALNWLWCAGIVYSTVAIRQHVALDAFAGAGLGGVVGAASLRWGRGARELTG